MPTDKGSKKNSLQKITQKIIICTNVRPATVIIATLSALAISWIFVGMFSIGYKDESIPSDDTCTIEGQKYKCGPAFNVNGDGLTYGEAFLLTANSLRTNGDWDVWNSKRKNAWRPKQKVFKIVVMHRNEFPLIRFFIKYHGELVGYDNLYVIDGSTNEEAISYLKHARDDLGVNVIFSKANLNEVEKIINLMFVSLVPASDMIIKMDTDEFLAYCKYGSVDCTLDPAGMIEHINSENFILDGRRMKIGFTTRSLPNKTVCERLSQYGDDRDYKDFLWTKLEPTNFKTFFDSRTFKAVDLGSHGGDVWPSKEEGFIQTHLAILHFQLRCFETVRHNDKQACEQHGYVNASQSEAEQREAITQFLISKNQIEKAEDVCVEGKVWDHPDFPSVHKVWRWAQTLVCPEKVENAFYKQHCININDCVDATGGTYQTKFSGFVESVGK